MVVRRATADDWEVVREVRLRALADSPEAFGSTYARESTFPPDEWQRRVAPGNWVVALDADGVAIGMAAGVREQGRPEAERHLVGMWVAPQWRGRGVASDLVAEVQRWADGDGGETLTLWVAESNGRARAFYERLGFRATGERQPLPSDPDRAEERMVRP